MTPSSSSTLRPSITIYKAQTGAGRIKVQIPYACKTEREAFKKLNTTFYHSGQKLWSIANTPESRKELKALFGDKLKEVEQAAPQRMPEVQLNAEAEAELNKTHQKMVLKGFSKNTIQNYLSALRPFFKYFEMKPLASVSKEEIEGYVYVLITKYKIGESTQNTTINAINPVGSYNN